MKYTVALITASLAVITASKQKGRSQTTTLEKSESDSIEDLDATAENDWDDNGPIPLDLKGSLRRALAYDAALVDPIRNIVCSPVTALLPLGKLVLGTDRGQSRDELLKALGYQKNKVKIRLRSLISKLHFLKGVTLAVASTIYISDKKQLVSKYHRGTMSVFKSTIQKVDLEIPREAAAVINRKVFDGTHGKIPEVISYTDITPNTSLILINVVYFTGRWKIAFTDIKVEEFHSPAGVTKVSMMNRDGDYYYFNSDILAAQLIEIPYEGDVASLIIVLPMVQNGLTLLLRQLKVAPELLNQAISKMRKYKVYLSMPKFKTESVLDLKSLFEKLGVKQVFFENQSGLSRIIREKEKLWVNYAKQKAVIEISELGSAGDATATAVAGSVPRPANEAIFKADRPFLYFVKLDGEQLFAGIFNNN